MARISKYDECFICGETPCGCRSKKKLKIPTGAVHPEAPAPASGAAPVVLEIPQLRPHYTPQPRVKSSRAMQVSDEELVTIAALRNIESIMHDDERARLHSLLMAPQTFEERLAFWKARRAIHSTTHS